MTVLHEPETLKKTPLYSRHLSLNAKIVGFGGWAMPVYYSGIIAEHRWVREKCGVFDVSHLGEIRVKGKDALSFLQHRLTNNLSGMKDGQILYNLLCDENGFALDDILVYRAAVDDYYLIVNAANIAADLVWLEQYVRGDVLIRDQSDQTACVAVQGPLSESILEKLFSFSLKALGYYRFIEAGHAGKPVWISRSGYTGEDGFEIFAPAADIAAIWDTLIAAGEKEGVLSCGLGARNTLRLEAGNGLYGNDLDRTTTPLEAGLGWAVSFDKGDFVGRQSLWKQKQEGLTRRLAGFKILERAIAREHYPIFSAGRKIGAVTSGSYAPTVDANIGLGYVEKDFSGIGTEIEIEVHGRPVKAQIVKRPFIALKHKNNSKGGS